MNFIQKYNIKFIPLPYVSIYETFHINLYVLYSILKVELFYYRRVAEIYRAIINIIMALIAIFYYSEMSIELITSHIMTFIILNLDMLLIAFGPVPAHIQIRDTDKLYVDAEINEEETVINYDVKFKNRKLFSIKNPIHLDPNLMIKLLNEYLEEQELKPIPEYRKRFIQENLEAEFN